MKISEILNLETTGDKDEVCESLQDAYEKALKIKVKFNKPFPVYFFEREDGKPLASTNPILKQKIAQEDNKTFVETGKMAGIVLTKCMIEHKSDLVNIFKRGEKGEVKFIQSLESQLFCELFDQCGLTTIVRETSDSLEEK